MTELIFNLAVFLIPLGLVFAGLNNHVQSPLKAGEVKNSPLLLIPSAIGLGLAIVFQWQGLKLNSEWITIDPVRLILLTMILFLSVILIKYSRNYMLTDENRDKFYKYTYYTLASVVVFAIINNTLLLWFSWLFISLNLHHLLLHYPNRPRAQLAAHKKFIFARVAEVFLLTAVLLLYSVHQTFNLNELLAHYQGGASLSFAEHLAAVSIGLAALIKCAQLPFHGWLIQVVEAPTPVSVLLHAGVINLGGVLLLMFAPLVLNSIYALGLVFSIASITTVLAALVMKTRVSYKVNLAWSTSAQMGLMLVECALGAWDIFLLHLIGHSLYKAYAFLSHGEAVNHYINAKANASKPITWVHLLVGILTSAGLFYAVHLMSPLKGSYSLWLLLGLGVALLIAQQLKNFSLLSFHKALFSGITVIGFYLALKQIIQLALPQVAMVNPVAHLWLDAAFALAIATLFILDRMLNTPSFASFQANFGRWLYSGFYLDEYFTALTFKIWPVRLQIEPTPEPVYGLQPNYVKES